MTDKRKLEIMQEVNDLLLKIDSEYVCDAVYENNIFGVYIILKNAISYLNINVSMKKVCSYYKENNNKNYYVSLDYEELKTALAIIDWWYFN